MINVKSSAEIKGSLVRPVVTLGNFDGVHLGHREIFRRVVADAASINGCSVVVTFNPHPLKVVPNFRNVSLITTYREKEKLIEASGIDVLVSLPFNSELAEMPPKAFIHDILVDNIGVNTLYIGYDYAFGHNREGRVPLLVASGREHGFKVKVMEPINNGSEIYSSSAIRRLVQTGDVASVVPLLGRHFSLEGDVIHGYGRGNELGFPTANISSEKELLPPDGVYAVKVRVDGEIYDGACNIGKNPTFKNSETSIEVHLFDFCKELYGKSTEIFFFSRIRGERKFTGPEALKEAISFDIIRCREILSASKLVEFSLNNGNNAR